MGAVEVVDNWILCHHTGAIARFKKTAKPNARTFFALPGNPSGDADALELALKRGVLTSAEVHLAARLGHAGALRLHPTAQPIALPDVGELPHQVRVRASVAVLEWAFFRMCGQFTRHGDYAWVLDRVERTLDALGTWLSSLAPTALRSVGKTTAGIDRALTVLQYEHDKPLEGWLCYCLALATKAVLQLTCTRSSRQRPQHYDDALCELCFLGQRIWPGFHAAGRDNARPAQSKELQVVCSKLLPWVLHLELAVEPGG